MKQDHTHDDALNWVRAEKISTGKTSRKPVEENVCVVSECPLTIDVEGYESYTILCTPVDKLALAAGFLYTEGVFDSMADIRVLKECDDDPSVIRVRLDNRIPRIGDPERNLLISSSCGACGTDKLQQRINALPRADNTLKIQTVLLHSVFADLRSRQTLFETSGGTHAAALFDGKGKILAFAEDTGRHNALDKVIGKCLLANTAVAGTAAALTSRLSLEMVSKCAVVGIELIASVSAPTSMAIDVAENCNITLCAFVRETRATVFTHPSRIISR